MSHNFEAVAALARSGAEKMRWMIDLADELERLGALDQAAKETELRLATLRSQEVAMRTEIDELSKSAQAARESAASAVAEAHSTADNIVAAAQVRNRQVAVEADAKALAVVDAARADASALLDEARHKALAALEARAEAQAEMQAAADALVLLKAETAETQDKLEKAQAGIDAILGAVKGA